MNTNSSPSSCSESDDSGAESDVDPRFDLENYKEILISASSNEDHLQFQNIDKFDCKVDKFHIDLNMLMKKDPTLDTKAAYDATRMLRHHSPH